MTAATRTGPLLRTAAAFGAAAATIALAFTGAPSAHADASTNCQATPSGCGYPDARNTGVPAGTTLTAVPAQATSGPGWSCNATTKTVNVSTDGTVLSGLNITGSVSATSARLAPS